MWEWMVDRMPWTPQNKALHSMSAHHLTEADNALAEFHRLERIVRKM